MCKAGQATLQLRLCEEALIHGDHSMNINHGLNSQEPGGSYSIKFKLVHKFTELNQPNSSVQKDKSSDLSSVLLMLYPEFVILFDHDEKFYVNKYVLNILYFTLPSC